MNLNAVIYITYYLLIIGIVGIVITINDKHRAKRHQCRISEHTLFATAALGAALPMFITMLIIRHKTKHKSFMIGLPVIFVLHIILLAFYARFICFAN